MQQLVSRNLMRFVALSSGPRAVTVFRKIQNLQLLIQRLNVSET